MICRSYGAYRNLGNGNYKDFAPTEHHPDLRNVQIAGHGGLALKHVLSNLYFRPLYSIFRDGER